jgi:transketolase
MPDLDELAINTVRLLAVDAVQQANSGHPGAPLALAPAGWLLYSRFLKHNPADPGWFDRDRFVLSNGHASMLLYGLLHVSGYDLPLDEIKAFRQYGSRTPGHPERGHAPGVETTTGPLGQGCANAVGMAMAEAYLAARYNRPGHEIIDHETWAFCSDGDLMEGVAAEAVSLAGHLRLGKLTFIYDTNSISLAGSTSLSFEEDVAARFEACGWRTHTVVSGEDLAAIDAAYDWALSTDERPSLIVLRTVIGYGSPNKAGTFGVHGSPLGVEEAAATRAHFGWPDETFHVPREVSDLGDRLRGRGALLQRQWQERLDRYRAAFPAEGAELDALIAGALPSGWDDDLPDFERGSSVETRKAAGRVLSTIAPRLPGLIGGSADLNPSTDTAVKGLGDFQSPGLLPEDRQGAVGGPWGHEGKNLHFGVREHAMASTMNGMAAHGGIRPYGATFLTFSDYMKPAIRLACLMGLPTVYVFTHDSVWLGEDGPTHQPIEHLAALRAIPGMTVFRPADAEESVAGWTCAIASPTPFALVLTRQKTPVLQHSDRVRAARGAYVIEDSGRQPDIVLIATGSEVALAVAARALLEEQGLAARVVSMPSWELFQQQAQAYRDEVLPPGVNARLSVEAASPFGWERWTGCSGKAFGIDRFGASAPYEVLREQFGFTPERIAAEARALLSR